MEALKRDLSQSDARCDRLQSVSSGFKKKSQGQYWMKEEKNSLLNKENETTPNRITAEEHNQSWSDMNYT